jgi:hypothetical protein
MRTNYTKYFFTESEFTDLITSSPSILVKISYISNKGGGCIQVFSVLHDIIPNLGSLLLQSLNLMGYFLNLPCQLPYLVME